MHRRQQLKCGIHNKVPIQWTSFFITLLNKNKYHIPCQGFAISPQVSEFRDFASSPFRQAVNSTKAASPASAAEDGVKAEPRCCTGSRAVNGRLLSPGGV